VLNLLLCISGGMAGLKSLRVRERVWMNIVTVPRIKEPTE